jgi:hypothetical protein
MDEQQVACSEVKVGDAIQHSTLQRSGDPSRLANVTCVTLLGAFVKIDTDLGHSDLLPVNRSITIRR